MNCGARIDEPFTTVPLTSIASGLGLSGFRFCWVTRANWVPPANVNAIRTA